MPVNCTISNTYPVILVSKIWPKRPNLKVSLISNANINELLTIKLYLHWGTYPNSCFGQIRPHCYFFPRTHIWIPVSSEGSLKFLQLLTSKMSSLSSLSFILFVVFTVIAIIRFNSYRWFCFDWIRKWSTPWNK